uniref:Uncharacterized protein n=1 Tax=Eutreptiella gymnastica TaxID=73025 RepID=A0A7S1JBD1_9EUGL|mmetsp:Transcript_79365/g.140047  ORF Transcript_79365/g.140047 Transcript_79365/m.140047 type:complete len:273 (+) Transcript_79365:35-853(+)
MDTVFVLQLLNALLLCWVSTEWSLSGKVPIGRYHVPLLVLWLGFNTAVLVAHLDEFLDLENAGLYGIKAMQAFIKQAVALVIGPLTWPLALMSYILQHVGTAGLVSFLVVAAFGVILSSHKLQQDEALRLWRPQPLVAFVGTWALLWVIFSRWGTPLKPSTDLPVRVFVIVAAYYGLCYWDVKRTRPGITHGQFARYFLVAAAKSLLLMPVVTIVIATIFLVIVTALQQAHLPTAWLNWPIYYGALYGPASAVYFFTRRQSTADARHRLLPV